MGKSASSYANTWPAYAQKWQQAVTTITVRAVLLQSPKDM